MIQTKIKFFAVFLSIAIVSCASISNKKNSDLTANNKQNTTIIDLTKPEVVKIPYIKKDSILSDPINFYKDTLSIKSSVELLNGVKTEWISSYNYNLRKPNFVIIHHTAQDSLAQTIKTFTKIKPKVSAHYVIADDGRVVQMVNDYLRAWHGGNSFWGKNTDLNSASIGIELDNNGVEPFSDKQIISLISLLTKLKKNYNIPTENFIGHSDIAPTRKKDPSKFFPWKLLALNGFGLWPDEILEKAPENFNAELGLRIIGYNTKNLEAAITAFKLHYIQTEVDAVLDEKTVNTIYNIYKKL